MMEKFDIDFVVSNFQVTNLKHYLDLLKDASKADLRNLRRKIKRHKKHNRQHQAFTNVKKFSTHGAIIAAINHELLKTSFYYPLYKILLRLRSPIVKTFTGLDLKETEYFGALYMQPENFHHYYLHMSHKEFLPLTCLFLKKHSKHMITTIIAIVGLMLTALTAYIAYLQLIKAR